VVYTQFERDHESVIPCTKIDFSGVSFTLNVTAEGHVNMRDSGNFWRTTVFGTVLQQLECGVSLAFADRVLPRGGSCLLFDYSHYDFNDYNHSTSRGS